MIPTPGERAAVASTDFAARIDLRRVRAHCERIRAGLVGLYEWIPIRPLSGAAVARWTRLKGPLCRRVLAAVQHRGDPAELARILPGVEGLNLFVDALERRDCPAELTGPARQAIHAFAELMHEGGGSQRKLVAAIRESLEAGDEGPTREAGLRAIRRRMFETARNLTGTSCDAMVAVSIVYRAKDRTSELDAVGALGRLGYRARPDAPPLIAKRYSRPEVGTSGERGGAAPASAPGLELQRRLGTPGLELTETRLDDERVLMTCESPGSETPIDLWLGPVRDEGIVRFEAGQGGGYSSHAAIGTPSVALVHDLWVERPLARASVLRAGAYRATPDSFSTMDYERWYDRLPGDPQILLPGTELSSGIEGVSPHHPEVIEQCFEHAGRDRADFVGYRCIIHHPIWMALYRFTLEFDASYAPDRASRP